MLRRFYYSPSLVIIFKHDLRHFSLLVFPLSWSRNWFVPNQSESDNMTHVLEPVNMDVLKWALANPLSGCSTTCNRMGWWLHNGCVSSTSPPANSPSSLFLHVFQKGAMSDGRSKSCPATINSKAKNSECSGEEVQGNRVGEVGSYPNLITRTLLQTKSTSVTY